MRDLVSKNFTPVYHGAQQQKKNPDIIPGTQLTKIFRSGSKKKKTRAEDCTTLSHTATWLSRGMLAALHPTGGYVVGLCGALFEWGSALARTQAIGTELGDVGQGFQAFRGFRDSNGDCPPSPLAGSACMCVNASTNLAVAVTASGTAYVWGQHPDVHQRRFPPAANSPALGNGALIVSVDQAWVYEPLADTSVSEMQPTEAVLPKWCPRSESKAERILLAVAGSHEVAIVTGNGMLLLHRPPHVKRVEDLRINRGDVLGDTLANCVRHPDHPGARLIPNQQWQLLWHPRETGHMVVGVAMGTDHGVLVTKQGLVFSWGEKNHEAASASSHYNAKQVDIHGAPLEGFCEIVRARNTLQEVWDQTAECSWFKDAEGNGVPIIEVSCVLNSSQQAHCNIVTDAIFVVV